MSARGPPDSDQGRTAVEPNPAKWGGTTYHDPPLGIDGNRVLAGEMADPVFREAFLKRTVEPYRTALEKIRAIVDAGPHPYTVRDIKAVLGEVLGAYSYKTRKPCP